MLQRIPAILLHLLPAVPFALHHPFAGVAALLLVALAYIKVQKLRATLAEEERKFGRRDDSLVSALEFWEKLTFLPQRK